MDEAYSFPRYLAAKRSVDDRALNRQVWGGFRDALQSAGAAQPLRLLEVGAGIGTMLERLVDWGALGSAHYTAIDAQPVNIAVFPQRITAWARGRGFSLFPSSSGLVLSPPGCQITLELEAADVFEYARRPHNRPWDVLVAHAFLDLVDLARLLPALFGLLSPSGWFYFSLNFDGLTAFLPQIDPHLDEHILNLYHRTMDERLVDGTPSGHSRTGRRLFEHIPLAGGQILAAGASDWLVYPSQGGYPHDEAYFLHFILHTLQSALAGHPELDPAHFAAWLAERRLQVERGQLVYLAHQIDFFGQRLP